MNKKELLTKIKELNLPKEEFYILSGASLLIRDLRTNTDDIDLCVTEKGFEILKERFNIHGSITKQENGCYKISDHLECFIDNKLNFDTDIIEGYQIQTLTSILKFKKEMNRKKDLNDIKIIREYIKNNIIIRKIEVKDIRDVVTLINECWKKAYKKIMSVQTFKRREENKNERIEKWKNNINKRNGFVAEIDNKIVGYCEYILNSDLEVADCEVTILYVDNNYQSLGIGKKLIEFARSKLKGNDKKTMAIRCLEENRNGREFYKKIGGIELDEVAYFECENKKYKEKIYMYQI